VIELVMVLVYVIFRKGVYLYK